MKRLSQYFTEKLNTQFPVLEGGASGHMLHPYDVDEFTGYDIEELIRTMFGGKMEGMTEKMDGFGMQASMNPKGEVVFIRNKTNLNSEKGGMTLSDFATQWVENPTALDNYTRGGKIIEAVFRKIGPEWFNPSPVKRLVVNCECILAGTTNTIPYPSDQVDFHNIWIYEKQESDSEWKNTEVTKKGLDVLEKACEGIDNAKITPPVIVKYSEETARLEKKWLGEWQKFLKQCDCAPDVTIEGLKYSLFFKWVEKYEPWIGVDHKAATDCCRRWLFGDKKSADLKDLKAIYQDNLDTFVKLDKTSSKVVNTVLTPLQNFFYSLGADVIKVTSGFVNDGQDGTIKTLLGDLKVATDKIRREGSLEDNEFLQKWLDVLSEIGEENLRSAEGIVFSYKGKMMKFTGGFVPLNRIIGYSKYTMKPKSLQESLFDGDLVKSKTIAEKLAYVLKKFFGPDVALCEDYQGSYKWYEVNPSTMKIKDASRLKNRIVKYCEKIDGIEVREEKVPSMGSIKAKYIGDKTYWFRLNFIKYGLDKILVSKEFYDSMALPHDQKGVAERGWKEWQRW